MINAIINLAKTALTIFGFIVAMNLKSGRWSIRRNR